MTQTPDIFRKEFHFIYSIAKSFRFPGRLLLSNKTKEWPESSSPCLWITNSGTASLGMLSPLHQPRSHADGKHAIWKQQKQIHLPVFYLNVAIYKANVWKHSTYFYLLARGHSAAQAYCWKYEISVLIKKNKTIPASLLGEHCHRAPSYAQCCHFLCTSPWCFWPPHRCTYLTILYTHEQHGALSATDSL